jgi:hypothetical protein
MLEWARGDFQKKHAGTRCIELISLHSVGSAGHVVHSDVPRARNVDVLFSILGSVHRCLH